MSPKFGPKSDRSTPSGRPNRHSKSYGKGKDRGAGKNRGGKPNRGDGQNAADRGPDAAEGEPGGERPRNAETRWIGGFDAVAEAMAQSPYDCRDLWIEHEHKHPAIADLIKQAKDLGVNVQYMARPELDRAVKGGKHQGVAMRAAYDPAETFGEWVETLDDQRKKGMVVVVLDQIQDPHNLGAITRSALQLGAHCVVIPERRSAPVTQAVIQASAGAALKIPVHRVVNLAQTLAHCKKHGFWVYGADAAGKPAWDVVINTPAVLVIGSEGYGMRPLVRASCDELLSIPQVAHGVGSLNASCAATALLYEVARQNKRA